MRKLMIAAAVAAATASTPVLAQVDLNNAQGLVNVTVDDVSVLNNFLNDSQIAALNNLNVPVTVQVPIGVAANVCNISAAVLAKQAAGAAPCDAKSGSNALAKAVAQQKLGQKK